MNRVPGFPKRHGKSMEVQDDETILTSVQRYHNTTATRTSNDKMLRQSKFPGIFYGLGGAMRNYAPLNRERPKHEVPSPLKHRDDTMCLCHTVAPLGLPTSCIRLASGCSKMNIAHWHGGLRVFCAPRTTYSALRDSSDPLIHLASGPAAIDRACKIACAQ